MQLLLLLVIVTTTTTIVVSGETAAATTKVIEGEVINEVHHDYCIIGAGPGGVQLGYFMAKRGRDYVILEMNDHAGSFYDDMPKTRLLISINKKYMENNDDEFRFRHDWNSLISNDTSMRMTEYTDDYFPKADTFIRYLNDYTKHFKLNIRYNHYVRAVARARETDSNSTNPSIVFILRVHHGDERLFYVCRRLIAATGLSVPNVPEFEGNDLVTWYSNMEYDPDTYRNTSILILGKGNSAFETADFLTPLAKHIHIMGRHVIRLSFFTHYVGDVRAINNRLLDQYQLKSLDGMLEGDVEEVFVRRDNKTGKLSLTEDAVVSNGTLENDPLRFPYDHVIGCLGFVSNRSMFNQRSCAPSYDEKGKYPLMTPNYESKNVKDLYFAGATMHGLDVRKSSGGFIHGFRYLVEVLFNHMEDEYHHVRWPSYKFEKSIGFLPFVLRHLNRVSSLYQMFQFLCDVVIINEREGESRAPRVHSSIVNKTDESRFDIEYFTSVPKASVNDLVQRYSSNAERSRFFTITLEYGANFKGPSVLSTDRAVNEVEDAEVSNFLHPVWREYDFTRQPWPKEVSHHHTLEDFTTDWSLPHIHVAPLTKYLDAILFHEKRLNLPKKPKTRKHYGKRKKTDKEPDPYRYNHTRKADVLRRLGKEELEGWDEDPYRSYIREEVIEHLVKRQEEENNDDDDDDNDDDDFDTDEFTEDDGDDDDEFDDEFDIEENNNRRKDEL